MGSEPVDTRRWQRGAPPWRSSAVSQKTDHRGAACLVKSAPRRVPRRTRAHETSHTNVRSILRSVDRWKQRRCPPGRERKEEMWAPPAARSATRRSMAQPHAAVWTDAENLPERGRAAGAAYGVVPDTQTARRGTSETGGNVAGCPGLGVGSDGQWGRGFLLGVTKTLQNQTVVTVARSKMQKHTDFHTLSE